MAKFIEVTTRDNAKRLINVNIIEQDHITTKESYSEVKKMLLGGADCGALR